MASTNLNILLTLNHIPMIDLRETKIPAGIVWGNYITGKYLDEDSKLPPGISKASSYTRGYLITNLCYERNATIYGDLEIIDTAEGRILYNDIAIYDIPITFKPDIVTINSEISTIAIIDIYRKGKHQDINVDNT